MGEVDDKAAKEIFLRYGGSHFHMARDGEYDRYKSFGISKKQEKEWIDEDQNDLLVKVAQDDVANNDFLNLSASLRNYRNTKNFIKLLEVILSKNNLDTFTMIRMCEEVLTIASSFIEHKKENCDDVIPIVNKFFCDFWDGKIDDPITVEPYYHSLDYLNDVISVENVSDRKKRLFGKIKQLVESAGNLCGRGPLGNL